jgi:hypothetical protein
VSICLDAALEHEWDELQKQLPDAAKTDDEAAASLADPEGSLADPMPATRVVIEKMEALRERMAASQVTFTFSNIPWTERLELQATHRPRTGNFVDSLRGYNTDTFTRALIQRCCTQVVDEDGDTLTEIPQDVWDSLLGRPATDDTEASAGALNWQQVNRLFAAAFKVTDGETEVPPTARFLLESKDSGASLAQPGPGTPPPSGSAAGNRSTSRKSSATKKAGSSVS